MPATGSKRRSVPEHPPIERTAAANSAWPQVFVSYCHKDDGHREKLDAHLASMKRDGVAVWWDGDISPGGELDPEIRRALRQSTIFVALASPDYLNSSYCFEKEYRYALRRAARKTMHVVVAIVRPCQWKHTRMARYKALPKDGKAVALWANRDLAFDDIVTGLRRVVSQVRAEESAGGTPNNRASISSKGAARKASPPLKRASPRTRKITGRSSTGRSLPSSSHGGRRS